MSQEQQQQAAPVPGSPEHDAAMLAKYNAAQGLPQPEAQPEGDQRPAWLPEKFKSAEDLAKAYDELSKKLGAPKDEKPAEGTPADVEPTDDKSAKGQPADGSFDWSALGDEIATNGGLTPESRAAIAKLGIPDAIIDSYVAAQVASVQSFTKVMHEAAGGEQEFEKIREWSSENLSDAEKKFLQAQVAAGTESAKMAVATMKARYEAVHGRQPNLLGGQPSSKGAGYASTAEMMRDMGDPRYKTDSAFRALVEQRLANASF